MKFFLLLATIITILTTNCGHSFVTIRQTKKYPSVVIPIRALFRGTSGLYERTRNKMVNDSKAVDIGDSRKMNERRQWTHSDIKWRLVPPPETKLLKKITLRVASMIIRADCWLRRKDRPPFLAPKGGSAVLEAHANGVSYIVHSAIPKKTAIWNFKFIELSDCLQSLTNK